MIQYYSVDNLINGKAEDLVKVARVTINTFTNEQVDKLAEAISLAKTLKQSFLPVTVNSFGGSVYHLFSMIALLRGSGLQIITFTPGMSMSAGGVLFSCGSPGKRYISPDATIMVHEVSAMTGGKNEDIQADAREYDRLNKKLMELLAENCGQPKDYFIKMCHDHKNADVYLTPEQALFCGLASKIAVPSIEVKVSAQIELNES
jgi:ATP-dependent Clp protease, protease subunit